MAGRDLFATRCETPWGPLELWADTRHLVRILLPSEIVDGRRPDSKPSPILREACRQLADYFAGKLTEFQLPLSEHTGTKFQQRVWQELCRVPYGTTISYTTLAARIGRPKAVRAVGAANGRNPIPIVVPCHRIIGRNGSLTGYAGGLEMKQNLLRHEGAAIV